MDADGGVLRVVRKNIRGRVGPVSRKKRAPREYPLHPRLAEILRDHRHRLLEQQAPGIRQAFRAHDLRATFVTIHLTLGKTETWVSDRTGHHSHEMIDRYRRKARTWNLGPLLAFDRALPEMQNLAAIDTTGELVEDVASPRIRLLIPTRLHGLPREVRILDDSHFAQRKPMAPGEIGETRSIEKTSMEGKPRGPENPRLEGPVGQSWGNPDPVETALAKALERASVAERWDIVAQLAKELEARRLARTSAAHLREDDRSGRRS
jgi:hypothetical protein